MAGGPRVERPEVAVVELWPGEEAGSEDGRCLASSDEAGVGVRC